MHDIAKLKKAFTSQKWQAENHRKIKWKLSFVEWLDIWKKSRKLSQRGRGKGKYCMARYNDQGAYEVGNVYIQEHTNNTRDQRRWNPNYDLVRDGGVKVLTPKGKVKLFPNLKTMSRETGLGYHILWQKRKDNLTYRGYTFL